VSAAGIFASNLSQYGTKSTNTNRPEYTQGMLEEVMGRKIIDTDAQYKALEAESLLRTFETLGLSTSVPGAMRAEWERAAVLV
jgi:uncharacterized glyoxalase superfamily metalloenzyme YdcJ